MVCTDIKIVTTTYGSESGWTFGNCISAQAYTDYGTFVEECCQPTNTYELVCTDSFGDGWHGGYIEIGGIQYCGSFDTSSQSYQVVMPGNVKFKDTFSSSN